MRNRCPWCQKDYSCKSSLNRHLRLHRGYRPFKCSTCGKRFSQRSTLNNHGRIHSGERPYKCDMCPKQFVQKGNLLRHKRVHTGEKPYKCEICGRTFSQKGHLRTHSRIHKNGESKSLGGAKSVRKKKQKASAQGKTEAKPKRRNSRKNSNKVVPRPKREEIVTDTRSTPAPSAGGVGPGALRGFPLELPPSQGLPLSLNPLETLMGPYGHDMPPGKFGAPRAAGTTLYQEP